MTRKEQIEAKLHGSFTCSLLDIEDQSAQHHGHGGYDAQGSHFKITLRAPELEGLSRIARHRSVFAALGKDLTTEIHSISLAFP